jgi:hypothetical protein
MAKRRLISAQLTSDEEFNSLSLEAQNLFVRMLAVADDCGVVPADTYPLTVMTNPPASYRSEIGQTIREVVEKRLGTLIDHEGKKYFVFKRHAFDTHQSFILNKRTRSEYLRMDVEEFTSRFFPDILGSSCPAKVESKKQKGGGVGAVARSASSDIAANIYDYYALKVRPGARADAIRSISKLLREYSPEFLTACIDRYISDGLSSESKYRFQANNFFGRAERYKAFLPVAHGATGKEERLHSERDGPTSAELYYGGEQDEQKS